MVGSAVMLALSSLWRPTVRHLVLLVASLGLLTHCSDDGSSNGAGGGGAASGSGSGASASGGSGGETDITGAILTNTSADCGDYAGSYTSSARDVGEGVDHNGLLTITAEADGCTFSSNSIPNHDFNDGMGMFMFPAQPLMESRNIKRAPMAAAAPAPLSLQYDNAIFLNGVKLDLLAAACYGVGPDPLGLEKIGCFDNNIPWRYDPMFPANGFGTDTHNAHTQPDGAYHYHGSPRALFDPSGEMPSPVIGFAADGYPIFGPFIDDGGTLREVQSGYTLKSGMRTSQPGEGALPPGNYDGTFIDDYEFTDAGDLDACNGMDRNGGYGYYVTSSYPWVMACFRGTPDPSFQKMMMPMP